LVPALARGDYAAGLDATTQRLLDILNRKAVAPGPRRLARRRGVDPQLIFFGLIAIVFVVQALFRRRGVMGARGSSSRSCRWGVGGVWGGGGGGGGGGGWGGGGGDSGNFGGGDSGGGGASGSW